MRIKKIHALAPMLISAAFLLFTGCPILSGWGTGSLTVVLQPQSVVDEGAQWWVEKYGGDKGHTLYNSGMTISLPVFTYFRVFYTGFQNPALPVPPPPMNPFWLMPGEKKVVTITYNNPDDDDGGGDDDHEGDCPDLTYWGGVWGVIGGNAQIIEYRDNGHVSSRCDGPWGNYELGNTPVWAPGGGVFFRQDGCSFRMVDDQGLPCYPGEYAGVFTGNSFTATNIVPRQDRPGFHASGRYDPQTHTLTFDLVGSYDDCADSDGKWACRFEQTGTYILAPVCLKNCPWDK
ncbi:MAG TPA: hypothetical protein PLI09_14995 [Candidatus Hydrogenedentes bacterium]|nr:hypothetical protein [Candidatus Hydrogenedentota bacterium]